MHVPLPASTPSKLDLAAAPLARLVGVIEQHIVEGRYPARRSRSLTNSRVPDPWHSAPLDVISNLAHAAIDAR